jgi:hypothetical protein
MTSTKGVVFGAVAVPNSQLAPGHLVTCQQPGRLLSRQQLAVKAEIHAPLLIEGRNPDVSR